MLIEPNRYQTPREHNAASSGRKYKTPKASQPKAPDTNGIAEHYARRPKTPTLAPEDKTELSKESKERSQIGSAAGTIGALLVGLGDAFGS